MESKIVLDSYIISDVQSEADGGPVAGTFEAEEISTGGKVIVELMPAASLRDSVRGRLEAEALAAKKINHINIPRVYDFGFENDQFVYVTEHFDGIAFEEWVREHGAMPVEAVLRVALQIVRGLGTAAFYKIFHHAINPSNLVIVPGRDVGGRLAIGENNPFSGCGSDVLSRRRYRPRDLIILRPSPVRNN